MGLKVVSQHQPLPSGMVHYSKPFPLTSNPPLGRTGRKEGGFNSKGSHSLRPLSLARGGLGVLGAQLGKSPRRMEAILASKAWEGLQGKCLVSRDLWIDPAHRSISMEYVKVTQQTHLSGFSLTPEPISMPSVYSKGTFISARGLSFSHQGPMFFSYLSIFQGHHLLCLFLFYLPDT